CIAPPSSSPRTIIRLAGAASPSPCGRRQPSPVVSRRYVTYPVWTACFRLQEASKGGGRVSGSVSGTVVDGSGKPVVKAAVHVLNTSNGHVKPTHKITKTGRYTISGLRAGTYVAFCVPGAGTALATATFSAVPSINVPSGTNFTVTDGATTSGVNFTLG